MGSRKVTTYTEEFKRASAELAVTAERPISQTGKELGISVTTLHGWVNKYYPNKLLRQQKPINNDMAEELKRLKKENARLRQERDILKKTAAYFAKETQ